MSGIAEVLLKQGYTITGSDKGESDAVMRLRALGAEVFLGHDGGNIKNADVLVVSSAIHSDNPEVVAAKEKRIPVIPRAQMLAELMRFHQGIAIAGTHGKTTTTSLVASVLAEGDLDPTFVIGGVLNSAGTHAALGESQYFVAEADESDASFLFLNPTISVVTNIDADHMTTYDNDFNKLLTTFVDFLHRLPFYGIAIVCADNDGVRSILNKIARPVISYGFSEDVDWRISDFKQKGLVSCFKVCNKAQEEMEITLNLPGKHNALNALAAIVVAKECGVRDADIESALRQFKGVGRRIEVYGEINVGGKIVTLIDDYGHHPCEIKVTLEALRSAWPNRRLVLAFQPHRYTRLQSLFDDFAKVLAKPDVLLLLDVYSAGEDPIAGIDGKHLVDAVKKHNKAESIFADNAQNLVTILPGVLRDGDILLIQGAGSIGKVVADLIKRSL